jgi:beta-propeller repeat-containing protein
MLFARVYMEEAHVARRGLGVICAVPLTVVVLALILIDHRPLLIGSRTAPGSGRSGSAVPSERIRLAKEYGKLPLSFELNAGQTDARVKFLSRGSHSTLFLTANEAVLSLRKPSAISAQLSAARNSKVENRNWAAHSRLATPNAISPNSQPQAPEVLCMKLVGSNTAPRVRGVDELPGKSNYIVGNDPKKWRTNVPTYAKVKYEDVYPGVDLVYYGNQGRLEHDFVVAPGADPRAITLQVETGNSEFENPVLRAAKDRNSKIEIGNSKIENRKSKISIDAHGDLVVGTNSGDVYFRKPVVYQAAPETANLESKIQTRRLLDGHYVLRDSSHVTFELASYDPALPLTIDPVLSYSTYLGGDAEPGGQANAIAVDGAGNAYVTGSVGSSDFPTTAGAFQPACSQTSAGGCPSSGFVAKLNPEGTALVYSTFLGGSTGQTFAQAIAVDASGSAYVTGSTSASDYPTTPGSYQPNVAPHVFVSSAFVTKLNADGSGLAYSTYLGDSGGGAAIAVDGSGSAYVAGSTFSLDFPTTLGAFQRSCRNAVTGGCDGNAFVSKLNPEGSALMYSTYLGGSGKDGDTAAGIAVDSAGNAYVSGAAHSEGFPVTPGAFQTKFVGGQCEVVPPPGTMGPIGTRICSDAFATKLNATGSSLVYSTFLAGSKDDSAAGIAVDAAGSAYVAGTTSSPDYPTTPGAFQAGSGTVFVTKLNSAGSALVYSTRLGGSKSDSATGIALDASTDALVTGQTLSTDFPTANPIQAHNAGGSGDAFVAAVNPLGAELLFSTYLGGSSDDVAQGIAVDGAGNAYVAGHTDSDDFPVTSNTLKKTSHVVCQSGTNPILGYSAPCGSMFVTKIDLGLAGSAGDFSIAASPASATITAGQTATYTLKIKAVGSFNQTVALACSGAPQAASCSVSPSSMTMQGSTPATASVTVTTTARSMASPYKSPHHNPPAFRFRPWAALLWLMGLATLAGLILARRQPVLPVRRWVSLIAAPLLLLGILIGTMACGGGSTADPPGGGDPGTPQGTYTLTVSGTSTSGSPTLTHDATFTLTVK